MRPSGAPLSSKYWPLPLRHAVETSPTGHEAQPRRDDEQDDAGGVVQTRLASRLKRTMRRATVRISMACMGIPSRVARIGRVAEVRVRRRLVERAGLSPRPSKSKSKLSKPYCLRWPGRYTGVPGTNAAVRFGSARRAPSVARRRERGVLGPAEAGHHHSRFTLIMRPASSNSISTIQPSSPCRRWPVLIAATAPPGSPRAHRRRLPCCAFQPRSPRQEHRTGSLPELPIQDRPDDSVP